MKRALHFVTKLNSKDASFMSRIQEHGKRTRIITSNRECGRGCGGEVICHKKVLVLSEPKFGSPPPQTIIPGSAPVRRGYSILYGASNILIGRLSFVVIIFVPVMQISLSQCEQILLKTSVYVSFAFDYDRSFVQALFQKLG